MKTLSEFIGYLQERGKGKDWIELAENFLPSYLERCSLAKNDPDFARNYAAEEVSKRDDAYSRLVLMMWYHDFIGDKANATYLITLFGTLGVVESQKERLASLHSSDVADRVFTGIEFPPLGSDLRSYPPTVNRFLVSLQEQLSSQECQTVLAGNHHRIDRTQFSREKDLFELASGLEDYLTGHHARLVSNLQEHCDSGKLWFEQVITQEVVDYIKQHQEIQTGVLQEDKIVVHKIPYAPDAWLKERDPEKRRYLACHCPFVRASIPAGTKVSSLWCYCSGGFTKVFWDYIFDQDLEIELLSSVLNGDPTCSFAIQLPAKCQR